MLWGPSAQSMSQGELGSILQCLTAPEDFESLLQHVAAALDAQRPGSAGSAASASSVRTQMTAEVALQCLGGHKRNSAYQSEMSCQWSKNGTVVGVNSGQNRQQCAS